MCFKKLETPHESLRSCRIQVQVENKSICSIISSEKLKSYDTIHFFTLFSTYLHDVECVPNFFDYRQRCITLIIDWSCVECCYLGMQVALLVGCLFGICFKKCNKACIRGKVET